MTEDAIERVPTGIPGLDPILEGGLLKGAVYIIQGPPGAGKTLFGNQVCYTHTRNGGRAVYITLLAESHTRTIAHLRRMTFFDGSVIPEKLHYLSAFKVLEGEGLEGLLTTLRKAVTTQRATLLVLDGLVSAEEASPSPKEYKKFIHELQIVVGMMGCTALLLSSTERPRPFRPEHTMVDGIIDLSDELQKLRSIRHLTVRKMRGADPIRGQHTLEITNDGLTVRPRFEIQKRPFAADDDVTTGDVRLPFGLPELDGMLRGGVARGSSTMILGPTGAGKTILGMQFLAEGARRGEPGVLFGFYERAAALRTKSERIGLGFEQALDDGLVEIAWQRPVETLIDVLGERVLEFVQRTKAKRLFIDTLHGFQVAVDAPDRIRDVFAALSSELERLGVTTLYAVETPDLFGPKIEVPVTGVSAATQNVILMRHVELRSQLYRLISILKLRDSDYDASIREFRITDNGIRVDRTFDTAEKILSGTARTARTARTPTVQSESTSTAKKQTSVRPKGGKGRSLRKGRA